MNEGKYYNLQYLEEISSGDKNFVLDMLNDFVTNAPIVLLEIEGFTKESKWAEFYAVFHRFIPAYDFIGANSILSDIRKLENIAKTAKGTEDAASLLEIIKAFTFEAIKEINKDFFNK